jgi:hypothetical protein
MMQRPSLLSLALLLALAAPASAQPKATNYTPVRITPDGAAFADSRTTYIAAVASQATTVGLVLSIEAFATTGFKLAKVCVSSSNATAAAAVSVFVERRTTASSGGVQLTAEGAGTAAISKMHPSAANYGGVVRHGGTPGTVGARLDAWSFAIGEIGAGTADPDSPVICKDYGLNGEQLPTVAAGTANGLSITVTAAGAGGLASGSISATIIVE